MINAESGLMHSEDGGRDLQARKNIWPLSKKKKKKGKQKNKQNFKKDSSESLELYETKFIVLMKWSRTLLLPTMSSACLLPMENFSQE